MGDSMDDDGDGDWQGDHSASHNTEGENDSMGSEDEQEFNNVNQYRTQRTRAQQTSASNHRPRQRPPPRTRGQRPARPRSRSRRDGGGDSGGARGASSSRGRRTGGSVPPRSFNATAIDDTMSHESHENYSDEEVGNDDSDAMSVERGGDSGDGDGDGAMNLDFDGVGGLGAPVAANPVVTIEQYDLGYDFMLSRSPLYRTIVRQRAYRKMPKEIPTATFIADPLLGCRLNPNDFPLLPQERQLYLEKVTNERFWGLVNSQATILAKLPRLPTGDTSPIIQYIGDVALIVDLANDYAHPPYQSYQEEEALDMFGKINLVLWNYYLYSPKSDSSNSEKKANNKIYTTLWIVMLALHKMCIEKFPAAHGFLAQVYQTMTLGQFIERDKEYDDDDGGSNKISTNSVWCYMRRAATAHFVGASRSTSHEINNTNYDLPHSMTVISQPEKSTLTLSPLVNNGGTAKSRTAPRGYSNKVPLVNVFKSNDQSLGVRFCEMPLDVLLHVLMSVHALWINIEWTPVCEMLILLLWHHFACLVIDGPKMRRMINVLEHAKRKPITWKRPQTAAEIARGAPAQTVHYKPLSFRFIRDMANVFINELETIRLYYNLLEATLIRHPRAPHSAIAAFEEQTKTNATPMNECFKPLGAFDTLLHPECKQFLPSIRLQGEIDEKVVRCIRRLEDTVAGVDSAAAIKIYHANFIRSVLVPGSVTAVISKMPGMIPKPTVVIEISNSQILAPVGELTYQTTAPVICLGFLRPGNAFQKYLTNPRHARLALQAYDCMITSMLLETKIAIERRNRHQSFLSNLVAAATPSSSNRGRSNSSESPEDYLARILGDDLATLRPEDLETLVEYQLLRDGSVSAHGRERPLTNLVATFHKLIAKRKRTRPLVHTEPEAEREEGEEIMAAESREDPGVSERELPMEIVHDMNKIFICCTDAFELFVCLEKERIKWESGVRSWPRILKVRGESWVFEQESNFFLRTTDPVEALHAWYIATIYKFGREWTLTSGFLSLFETMVGDVYREVLFGQ